jgi:hypothetical protein
MSPRRVVSPGLLRRCPPGSVPRTARSPGCRRNPLGSALGACHDLQLSRRALRSRVSAEALACRTARARLVGGCRSAAEPFPRSTWPGTRPPKEPMPGEPTRPGRRPMLSRRVAGSSCGARRRARLLRSRPSRPRPTRPPQPTRPIARSTRRSRRRRISHLAVFWVGPQEREVRRDAVVREDGARRLAAVTVVIVLASRTLAPRVIVAESAATARVYAMHPRGADDGGRARMLDSRRLSTRICELGEYRGHLRVLGHEGARDVRRGSRVEHGSGARARAARPAKRPRGACYAAVKPPPRR